MYSGEVQEEDLTTEDGSCITIEIIAKFTVEQYTTVNQSKARRFDPRVFVNCLQVLMML